MDREKLHLLESAAGDLMVRQLLAAFIMRGVARTCQTSINLVYV